MKKEQKTAGCDDANTRLDVFIHGTWPDISRNLAQNLCESQAVSVNGRPAMKNYRVRTGDSVEVTLPEPIQAQALPENLPITIVYQDEHLIVVDKPQGMVVHPAPGNPTGTLVNALLYHSKGLSAINGVIRPGIVHRIDKDTGGLLVIARDDRTHLGLAEQFAKHTIDRVYYAVVHGRVKNDAGRIEAPIGRHSIDRKKMCVTQKNARQAATNYEVIERYHSFTLLRLRLETGRTHQIRVHMAYIGHPVAGDPVYGPAKGALSLKGQCLHAAVLGFVHPVTGEQMRFESPLPKRFEDFISHLKKESEFE